MSLAAATAADISRTIDGKEYKFALMRISDWGKLEKWLRERIINDAIERGKSEKDNATRRMILEFAEDKASKISFMAGSPEINTMESVIHILYLSMNRANSSTTKDVAEQLIDCMNQVDMNALIVEIIAQGDDDTSKKTVQSDGVSP